jgi:hypothetical protein
VGRKASKPPGRLEMLDPGRVFSRSRHPRRFPSCVIAKVPSMETVRKGAEDWEEAVLDGGPAHGLRIRVAGRPRMLQVTQPCLLAQDPAADLDAGPAAGPDTDPDANSAAASAPALGVHGVRADALRVDALHVYRRDPHAGDSPLRYGFDPASP